MASYLNSINFTPPPAKQRDVPEGLWRRCPICEELIFTNELERNLKICPKCDYHFPMSARERIENLIESFTEYKGEPSIMPSSEDGMPKTFTPDLSISAAERIDMQPIIAGEARLGEHQIAIVFVEKNFNEFETTGFVRFLGAIDNAKNKRLPLITFYDDGTVITPESDLPLRNAYALPSQWEWLSFIQIAQIVTALEELSAEKIPHITVLTSPNQLTGFITSFPLGDIVLMEPKPSHAKTRAGKKDNHKYAPKGQTSQLAKEETVAPLEYNLIDTYIPRKKLQETLDNLISFFAHG